MCYRLSCPYRDTVMRADQPTAHPDLLMRCVNIEDNHDWDMSSPTYGQQVLFPGDRRYNGLGGRCGKTFKVNLWRAALDAGEGT